MQILPAIIIGILLICIGVPLLLLSLPSTKGWAGEKLVAFRLKRCFPKGIIIFNDLYFHNGKRSCQIDHLVISTNGIFVIETKNYLGLVYGNASDEYIGRKVLMKRYRTYNPAKQNERHLEYLRANFPLIGRKCGALQSIVVFALFTKLRLTHNPGNIGTLGQIGDMIRRYSLASQLSQQECQLIATEICRHNRRR